MSDRAAIIPEGVMRSFAWTRLPGRDRAVLNALWLHAGRDRRCWPSKQDIAYWAGDLSRSSVTRALGGLEAAGLLQRLRTKGGHADTGKGVTGLYLLTVPSGADLRPLPVKKGRTGEPVGGCEDEPVKGRIPAPEGAQSCAFKGRTGEPGNSTGNSTGNTPRKKDAVWDAVVEAFEMHPVTKAERSRVGRVVRDLKLKQADPADVSRRLERYRTTWPRAADTPEALLKHWDRFGEPTGPLDADPVEPPDEIFIDE